jgi:hypothetical protein
LVRTSGGFTIGLEEKYYEGILCDLGLEDAKPVGTPLMKDPKPSAGDKDRWEEPLSKELHHVYRQVVGKMRFASPRRMDIMYAVQLLSRSLAAPQWRHWVQLRHLARYLKGTIDYRQVLEPRTPPFASKLGVTPTTQVTRKAGRAYRAVWLGSTARLSMDIPANKP